jgi:tRNA threonylcarbamoyladenosine modification (KEOPS) complex Cgi121 subunit
MTKKREKELRKLGISDYEIKEAKEQNKKEKVLLRIAILNWINVILMLIFIFVRFCNR